VQKFAEDAADFAGRLLIGLTFIYWGGRKLVDVLGPGAPDNGGWTAYMEARGVAGGLLPVVIATEIGFGLMLVLGYRTRIAAIALAGFCLLANVFFHSNFALPAPAGHFNWIVFIKNLALAGGLLTIAGRGPASWSADSRWRSKDGSARLASDAR
jgi:putative oxidoreductase